MFGDLGKRLGIDQRVEPQRQFAFRRIGKRGQQHIGNDEAQNPVAEKLETLVIGAGIDAAGAGMGQRALQALAVGKGVARAFHQRFGERIGGQPSCCRHDPS